MVTRILLEVEKATGDVVAQGVEYRKDGVTSEISSTREVILCAGTWKLPGGLVASHKIFRKFSNAPIARIVRYAIHQMTLKCFERNWP